MYRYFIFQDMEYVCKCAYACVYVRTCTAYVCKCAYACVYVHTCIHVQNTVPGLDVCFSACAPDFKIDIIHVHMHVPMHACPYLSIYV